eukprot:TRINITY_DN9458_c0_g1_i1.p1 TRINITY_DN9458_c0_g1~~TRINITY_DN9458_c0_g1_i1.p1  ORF type:complete len:173 (+),score=21.56 TRINITY_DN9458_c0_g1_i1:39-521(+)
MLSFSTDLESQCRSWSTDKARLKIEFRKLYTPQTKSEFLSQWSTQSEEIKTAVILTSIEDTLSSHEEFFALIPLAAPELLKEEEELLKDQNIIDIFDMISSGKENEDFFDESLISELVDNSPIASRMLELTRSCLLLNFSISVLLLLSSEVPEEALDEEQ